MVVSRIGYRDGLHAERPAFHAHLRQAEKGAVEWQHTVAVAAGAFGKENQATAFLQAGKHLIALSATTAHPALDEDRIDTFSQDAEQRPTCHLRLGNKGRVKQGREHDNIQIGRMIGHIKRRRRRRRRSTPLYLKAQQPAIAAMVEPGNQPLQARAH